MAEDYQVDWHQVNHEQLVYCKHDVVLDGKAAVDYKWSVLATNPDATDAGWQQRQRMLRSRSPRRGRKTRACTALRTLPRRAR